MEGWRHQARQYELLQSRMTLVRAELANVEREAGMAVLKAQELRQRLALTAQVPCAGSELPQRCRLLANAHAAQPLLPSANATIQRLNAAHQQLHADLAALAAQVGMHASAPQTLQRTLDRCKRTQARLSAAQLLVARKPDILRARANLGYLDARIGALKAEGPGAQTEEAAEREAIQAQLDTIATQEQEARRQACDGLARIDTLMAALPPPFDGTVLACASRALAQAQSTVEDAEQAYLRALHVQHQRDELSKRCEDNAHKEAALAKRIAYIETRLAIWSLFAKSLGNEGIVALAIDDAGPELSALTNDLLNACYGPRFTVSITTQLETAKGEAREGFAITVHDAVRGTAKNVAKMSGGERIWINECLTRAMALYLAHGSGRRSQTLFSDEADGAFDEQHKRQFMAMKREVLRIGGYAQEYFISHTPELAAMADAIIDLDQYCARPESVEGQASMNQGS
ncbi:hypothetical protein [Massilia sp. YIM B04103]|uniref:hypothetical protein n=1 Tax=Massilia sp. YIM B04103 TaxID=2963106 RepID=UPI00210D9B0F|nr:hypothetical protein [Massilia sp. YIM B04103]